MKKFLKLLALIATLIVTLTSLFACNVPNNGGSGSSSSSSSGGTVDVPVEEIDYVSRLTLDMNSETLKQEVTVKIYIDGDTTHFNVPNSVVEGGVLKARYLAINTPESTGKVEAFGKTASNFTKEKLSNAQSIIVESDDNHWNADSTGSRYLVWVWYRTSATEPYRNLNLEILQNGLAKASSTAGNRYGSICIDALNQAKALKLKIYSGLKDPNFYYGSAVELTLKELRCNIKDYEGVKVAFEGVVTRFYNNGSYLESYDEESEMYYGIYVYCGATADSKVLEFMNAGNKLRVVGTVSEFQKSYQVSGVSYSEFRPDSPDNIQLIDQDNDVPYTETTAETFSGKKVVSLEVKDEQNPEETDLKDFTYDYAELALSTTVLMKGLYVQSVFTTDNDGASDGAMTLTCTVGGKTITVRTLVLKDADGNVITDSVYKGKTIDVRGVVDCFNGKYQVKVLASFDITVRD